MMRRQDKGKQGPQLHHAVFRPNALTITSFRSGNGDGGGGGGGGMRGRRRGKIVVDSGLDQVLFALDFQGAGSEEHATFGRLEE